MLGLARLSSERPRLVLALGLIVAILAGVGASRVRKEEDLLVFLPTRDPDVQRFAAVSGRFGALRVALVGTEAPVGHDVLEADSIAKIARATEAMRNLTGVDRVVSLTSIADVVAGPVGAEVTPLVAGPPADEAAHAALKKKVMSRDHIVGNVISADGRAALMLVFLAGVKPDDNSGPTHIEDRIRATAVRELPGLDLTFGGAPFAGRAIYAEAESDVWRLSPIALLVLLLVVLVAFRDPIGVALTIASVAYATLIIVGVMGWLGEHWTVAHSTLPVILFASGSSYAVHVLGRYYLIRNAREVAATQAMSESLAIVAPPLAIAALTTSAGFFSFVATDVRPMRSFGIACGAGVLLCWIASLTIVPAVVSMFPSRRAHPLRLALLGDGIVWLWRTCARHRAIVLGSCALLAVLLIRPMLKVQVRMEPRLFFRKGSDPDRAEKFLIERFGGATFVQIAVAGDFDEPAAVRALAHLEDYARSLPGVTQVQSIVSPLLLVSDAMGAGRRLPATRGQAANLYFFLQGEPEVRSLLSEDRREALVHVRVADHADAVVDALERYAKERMDSPVGWPSRDEVADDLGLILTRPGLRRPDVAALHRATRVLAEPTRTDAELVHRSGQIIRDLLASPDAPELRPDKKAVAELAVERQTEGWRAAWRSAATRPDDADLAADGLVADLEYARRQLGVERAVANLLESAGVGEIPDVVRDRVARTVDDLFGSAAVASTTVRGEVAGEPVLDRGFSRAVEHNQLRSLFISIAAVLIFLYALFRRVDIACICMAPALLTLLYEMGALGLFGGHVDLGTSLVAGIATGAGADFAMHYLWYLRREDADKVSRTVGPVMAVSVALVALGFFVLALGRSPVMHLFGTLAGGAMALSALLSCFILPAALGDRRPW